MASLQYELIDALLSLRYQAHKDGWANWGGNYAEMVDLLQAHLPAGEKHQRILRDLAAIRIAGEGTSGIGSMAYAELDRLFKDLMLWCEARPEWISLPDGIVFWSDVPPTATAISDAEDESWLP